jgi:hypothetical protein
LKTENSGLMSKIEETEQMNSAGSMQCLVMAQSTLKERYSKMEQFILAISFIGGGNPITVENHRQRLLRFGLVYGV